MPLPDERPRQSVANLIGRFEKQKSSASPSAPTIALPRTSSVASHRTGDSTQEEVKEKREWPPKAVATLVSPPVQFSEKRMSLTSFIPPANTDKPALPEPEHPTPSVIPKPVSPSLPRPAPPQSTPTNVKPPPLDQTIPVKVKTPPSPSQTKPGPARMTTSVKSPAPKTTVKAVPEAPLKPQPAGDPAPSTSTPLKSQHTGQSTASAHTVTRVTAKPRASAPPKAPAVTSPARSRTPVSTAHAKSPSSVPRAKTPLSTGRPKTPSGLYAPTAASLARSRAGPPAPPPSEKPKRKVMTDLSKPTAASASKIRSPPTVTTTKVGKSSTGKPTATKAVAKPTTSKASTLVKRPAATKPRSDDTAAAGDDKAKNSSSGAAAGGGIAAISTTSAVSAAGVGESDKVSQQEDIEALVPDSEDVVEDEADDIHHTAGSHEESAVEQEHPEVLEQNDDEDIENYDEDFPDDISHETLEHENGHVMVTDMDSGSFVKELGEEKIRESASSLHDDDTLPVLDGHHPLEEAVQESQSTSESHHDASQLHNPEDVEHEIGEGQLEKAANGRKVEPDLEDLVNSLESGPPTQRASMEASPAEGTVSEAGEIPDED